MSGNLAQNLLYSYEKTYGSLRRLISSRIFWGNDNHIRKVDYENDIVEDLFSSIQSKVEFLDKPSDKLRVDRLFFIKIKGEKKICAK